MRQIQKLMKNKVFFIFLALILSLPVSVQAVDEAIPEAETVESAMPETQTVDVPPVLNPEINLDPNSFPHREPISKKKIAKKFLLAMLGVAISSFAIYFILTLYNKVRETVLNPNKTVEGETPLTTADDIDSAVKTFLEKTKWS